MSSIPVGTGSGVGSMPGLDPLRAAEISVGECEFAFLPELPARGLGADMVGRAAALLVDIPMDYAASGYRLSTRQSVMGRRSRDFLSADLDAFEEAWERAGLRGTERTVKVQACGPFTLAASVELTNGHKILHDRGAWTDLVDSLAEGLRVHADEVQKRTGSTVVVQIDEPMISRVIEGSVTPLTRFNIINPIPEQVLAEQFDNFMTVVARPVILHDCSADVPWNLLARTRFTGVSVDLAQIRTADLDGIGQLLDEGRDVIIGAVPGTAPDPVPAAEQVAASCAELTDRIGLSRKVLAEHVVVSPACGLAGADDEWAKRALGLCSTAAHGLLADPTAV
ncbi:vitamin-B12 independent methionine synthase [Williamsia soli]|uniref:vitamin-B12 independent methionine synthase n=1 Tax=Williamsia soli TaxID=364929 RepID=UPI001A9FA6DE|nr:vitamin-B12 independent methionine synthase [Williamsia soli]